MLRFASIVLCSVISLVASVDAKPASHITLVLRSVTLGDDCGREPPGEHAFADKLTGGPTTKELAKARRPPTAEEIERMNHSFGDSVGDSFGRCAQTSMTLTFTTESATPPTRITIKRVELRDAKSKVLQVLTATHPSRHERDARGGEDVIWDEKLGADEIAEPSYRLTSPNWNKLTGGRARAHQHKLKLRVTVTIGDSDRTVELSPITPARLAPKPQKP